MLLQYSHIILLCVKRSNACSFNSFTFYVAFNDTNVENYYYIKSIVIDYVVIKVCFNHNNQLQYVKIVIKV